VKEARVMDKSQYDLVKLIENSVQSPRKLKDGDILAWLYHHQIEEFVKIVGHDFLCEGGFEVNLQSDCICISLREVIDYMGIDEDIFEVEID
jgi:hypothetical protein